MDQKVAIPVNFLLLIDADNNIIDKTKQVNMRARTRMYVISCLQIHSFYNKKSYLIIT